MKQYKIGQKFRYKGFVYEVKKSRTISCDIECAFIKENKCIKMYCVGIDRKDKTNVYYKCIKQTLLTHIKNTIEYIMHPDKY